MYIKGKMETHDHHSPFAIDIHLSSVVSVFSKTNCHDGCRAWESHLVWGIGDATWQEPHLILLDRHFSRNPPYPQGAYPLGTGLTGQRCCANCWLSRSFPLQKWAWKWRHDFVAKTPGTIAESSIGFPPVTQLSLSLTPFTNRELSPFPNNMWGELLGRQA